MTMFWLAVSFVMKAPYMSDKRHAFVSVIANAIGWTIVFVMSLFIPKAN